MPECRDCLNPKTIDQMCIQSDRPKGWRQPCKECHAADVRRQRRRDARRRRKAQKDAAFKAFEAGVLRAIMPEQYPAFDEWWAAR